MKKLLLASTALVATASFAMANENIALSGSGEMGVKRENGADRTEFHTDISVTFTMSGESDNGLSFGAKIGLEEAQDGVATDIEDDYTVFVSAGSAKLTMGDTDGAFDKALTEVAVGSSLADDHTSHAGYNGNAGFDGTEDGQVARFDYTFSSVTLSVSAEIDDDGETVAGDNDKPVWGVGVAYSAELAGLDLGVGVGYQSQDDFGSIMGISLSTKFDNGLQAIVNYSKATDDDGDEGAHTAIGLGYSANALTIGLNYGVVTIEGDEFSSGLGLAVNYDLGGGLSAQFGYGSSALSDEAVAEIVAAGGSDDDNYDSFSLGLAMSF